MSAFAPEKLYPATDPALSQIASRSTMANWRSAGVGPEFVKLSAGRGGRILYSGEALNAWLAARVIRTSSSAAA